jgi:hypothetical protein
LTISYSALWTKTEVAYRMNGSLSVTTNEWVSPSTGKRRGHRAHRVGERIGQRGGIDGFRALDGEGIQVGDEHRYVLLGVGQEQLENPDGLHWRDIFEFIYSFHEPRTAFVGFYLAYDFTQWLKTLPQERAYRLLTIEGRESRRSKSAAMHGKFLPVDVDDWQVDMLGHKRMQIRPRACECETVKCPHKQPPWLYINDAGGFFQTSFLNVVNPDNWQHPIVTPEEYEILKAGKEHRADAQLDNDMRMYNRLENDCMERVMHDLNGSLGKLQVKLAASKWFGPGQAAQAWMGTQQVPKRTDLEPIVPEWVYDAARMSYFGGWFEIMAHGHIPGVTYEYDINNAYPFIIANLPCLTHAQFTRGNGVPPRETDTSRTLVRALVHTRQFGTDSRRDYIGAMLHRDKQARICRPIVTEGWYWQHELDAARRAKCITRISADRYREWVRIESGCSCPPPLRNVRNLYQLRLDVGKKSSLGKASKLINNSIYGKQAQSLGMPVYANPIYASLITSGCRTMILDAIASHPNGKRDVVMVATDAVFFLTPHPNLPLSASLGDWEGKARSNLTLFKPGVYWDDTARERIADGQAPIFKARGVSARDFGKQISTVDEMFSRWTPDDFPSIDVMDGYNSAGAQWPKVKFETSFAMTSALQALTQNQWHKAGYVAQGKELVQNAYPGDKRERIYADTTNPARVLYRSNPLLTGANAICRTLSNHSEWDFIPEIGNFESVPYEKRFGMDDPFSDEHMQALGIVPEDSSPLRSHFRLLTGQE